MVSLATCAEAPFAVLHTACRAIMQPCASAEGPLGQNGSQLPITLPLTLVCCFCLFVCLFYPDPLFVPFLLPVSQGKANACCTDLPVCQITAIMFQRVCKSCGLLLACSMVLLVYWSVKAGQWRPQKKKECSVLCCRCSSCVLCLSSCKVMGCTFQSIGPLNGLRRECSADCLICRFVQCCK